MRDGKTRSGTPLCCSRCVQQCSVSLHPAAAVLLGCCMLLLTLHGCHSNAPIFCNLTSNTTTNNNNMGPACCTASPRRRARMLQLWRSNVVSVVLYAWRHRLPFQWELLLQCATHLWVICFMNLPLCALFGGAPLSSSCLSRLAAAAPYYVDHAGDAAPGGESQSGGNPFVAAVEPLYAAVARLAEQLGGASGGGSAAYPASNPFAFLPADAEAMQDCADVRGCWTNVTLVQSVCFCVLLTAIHHFERAARIQYLRSMAPDVFQLVEFRGMHVMLILQCVWCMAITARFLLFSPTI